MVPPHRSSPPSACGAGQQGGRGKKRHQNSELSRSLSGGLGFFAEPSGSGEGPNELKARETAVVQQRLVKETRHLQAEETANKLVALGRKALHANDIRMAEAHFDQAFVIRPESEQVAKLRENLETHKLRAQEDHKRRAAERTNEEERTVKKLLDLARTTINEHHLQTAQTRLDEAAGIAPKSEAVASLRDELKARDAKQATSLCLAPGAPINATDPKPPPGRCAILAERTFDCEGPYGDLNGLRQLACGKPIGRTGQGDGGRYPGIAALGVLQFSTRACSRSARASSRRMCLCPPL